jgi:hypothetical protein
MRFVVLGTPAIGAKHFFPSSAPALKAGAVDLVIQRAEESEMGFFGGRECADYLPSEKLTSYLLHCPCENSALLHGRSTVGRRLASACHRSSSAACRLRHERLRLGVLTCLQYHLLIQIVRARQLMIRLVSRFPYKRHAKANRWNYTVRNTRQNQIAKVPADAVPMRSDS